MFQYITFLSQCLQILVIWLSEILNFIFYYINSSKGVAQNKIMALNQDLDSMGKLRS